MSGYAHIGGLGGADVRAAHAALVEGLNALREAVLARRETDVSGNRARGHGNEVPVRHQPGQNAKPVPGRHLPSPGRGRPDTRPAPPGQREPGTGPAGHEPTGELGLAPDAGRTAPAPGPARPGSRAGPALDTSPSTPPSTSPSTSPSTPPSTTPEKRAAAHRPDPADRAAEAWDLVERAQAGEIGAFGLLYDRYFDNIFRFVYFRVGGHWQLAEDLTSDTFLRALRNICGLTWQGRDPGAWLITIARNRVTDHFKSGRSRLEISTSDLLDADREARGPEASPESAVVDHITNLTLLRAVQRLNAEQQECVVLRFLLGFSVAETAQAMGKNEGAIKALQYRAVRTLARLLPEGFEP